MPCEDRARLEREHEEKDAAFDSARDKLRERIGVSPKTEFELLSTAVDDAWVALQNARLALDRHIREHRCHAEGNERSRNS